MKPVNLMRRIQWRTFSNNSKKPDFNIFEFMANKTVAERAEQHRGFLKQELFGADYYHYESPQYKREKLSLNIGVSILIAAAVIILYNHRKDTRKTVKVYNQFAEDLKFDNIEFKPNK